MDDGSKNFIEEIKAKYEHNKDSIVVCLTPEEVRKLLLLVELLDNTIETLKD